MSDWYRHVHLNPKDMYVMHSVTEVHETDGFVTSEMVETAAAAISSDMGSQPCVFKLPFVNAPKSVVAMESVIPKQFHDLYTAVFRCKSFSGTDTIAVLSYPECWLLGTDIPSVMSAVIDCFKTVKPVSYLISVEQIRYFAARDGMYKVNMIDCRNSKFETNFEVHVIKLSEFLEETRRSRVPISYVHLPVSNNDRCLRDLVDIFDEIKNLHQHPYVWNTD